MIQDVIVVVIVVMAVLYVLRRTLKSFRGGGCGCEEGCPEGKTCCDQHQQRHTL
ncbi:MAG: FeoB-associated Cys-rich membrane protein [Thermodesulfobacteriota bacterium]